MAAPPKPSIRQLRRNAVAVEAAAVEAPLTRNLPLQKGHPPTTQSSMPTERTTRRRTRPASELEEDELQDVKHDQKVQTNVAGLRKKVKLDDTDAQQRLKLESSDNANNEMPLTTNQQMAAPTMKPKSTQEKRTLRSQNGGTRLKSEVAVYFPELMDELFGSGTPEPGASCIQDAI
jgi:hypothetical protein